MKKTPGIIILIIWFVWSTVNDLGILLRSTDTTDYYIFSTNSLATLFFILAASILLLDAATVYYLFRPRSTGFYIALSALGLSVLQNILSMSLALADLPGAKGAYAAGREARGLPVRQEAVDAIFTPAAMLTLLVVMLVLSAVIALLVVKSRRYFFRDAPRAKA